VQSPKRSRQRFLTRLTRTDRDSEIGSGAIAPYYKTSPPNVSGLKDNRTVRPTINVW
jgi:hypothetical protein